MAITFDGPNKRAILSSGTTTLDVADLFSRWKDWVLAGNAQYLPAFESVGGNPIDQTAGTYIPAYLFLLNGWKVKPQEANHTLNVTNGILLVDGGGDPFVDTTGSYIVRINYQQPVQAITVATGGGSGGLTTEQATMLAELWRISGLDISNPMTVTPSSRDAGTIELLITGDPETSVTVARQ